MNLIQIGAKLADALTPRFNVSRLAIELSQKPGTASSFLSFNVSRLAIELKSIKFPLPLPGFNVSRVVTEL